MTDDSVAGYLARGWSVVALHGVVEGSCTCEAGKACDNAGKHPLYRNWPKVPIRTLDVWRAISGWRAERGIPTNVGLATGRASGVFALDVDPKNGGFDTLREYETRGWRLPATWEQKTGGSGLHCLFTMPADFEPTNSTGSLGPGLDIRGTGGQIVLAPSVTDKGAYEILRDTDPWASPHWLLDAIRPAPYTPRPAAAAGPPSPETDERAAAYASSARAGLLTDLATETGSRNSVAFRVACRLHELLNAGWLDYDQTYDAYLSAAEQASGLKREPFGQREADHVWQNAAHRTADKVADLPPPTLGGEVFPLPPTPAAASPSTGATLFAEPGAPAPAAPSTLNLPPEFWASRPVLRQIQLAAHARLVSADVLLHSVLVRLAALWPHKVRLDTGMLSPASANLFTAVVGPSGAGKSAGVGLAKRLLDLPHWMEPGDFADDRPLGSGEGMSEVYMGMKTIDKVDEHGVAIQEVKTGAKKTEKVRAQVRHNALLHADEGEVLAKVMERQGATLGTELRRAWSGGTIGQSNGRSETTRVIESGRYSLGLIIGFQLNTVQRLLTADETTSGTTQRFLFCWALDPSIPRERVPDPGPLRDIWPAPAGEGSDAVWLGRMVDPGLAGQESDLRPVTFEQGILDRLWIERYARATTMPAADEELASQGPVTVVKLSALLAYLDGHRRNVTEEDWRLATMVWEASCRVRDYAIETGRQAAGKAFAADRKRHADREGEAQERRLDVAEDREHRAVSRVAGQLARLVQAEHASVTEGWVRDRVAYRDRERVSPGRLPAALELAADMHWIIADGNGGYSPGPVRI